MTLRVQAAALLWQRSDKIWFRTKQRDEDGEIGTALAGSASAGGFGEAHHRRHGLRSESSSRSPGTDAGADAGADAGTDSGEIRRHRRLGKKNKKNEANQEGGGEEDGESQDENENGGDSSASKSEEVELKSGGEDYGGGAPDTEGAAEVDPEARPEAAVDSPTEVELEAKADVDGDFESEGEGGKEGGPSSSSKGAEYPSEEEQAEQDEGTKENEEEVQDTEHDGDEQDGEDGESGVGDATYPPEMHDEDANNEEEGQSGKQDAAAPASLQETPGLFGEEEQQGLQKSAGGIIDEQEEVVSIPSSGQEAAGSVLGEKETGANSDGEEGDAPILGATEPEMEGLPSMPPVTPEAGQQEGVTGDAEEQGGDSGGGSGGGSAWVSSGEQQSAAQQQGTAGDAGDVEKQEEFEERQEGEGPPPPTATEITAVTKQEPSTAEAPAGELGEGSGVVTVESVPSTPAGGAPDLDVLEPTDGTGATAPLGNGNSTAASDGLEQQQQQQQQVGGVDVGAPQEEGEIQGEGGDLVTGEEDSPAATSSFPEPPQQPPSDGGYGGEVEEDKDGGGGGWDWPVEEEAASSEPVGSGDHAEQELAPQGTTLVPTAAAGEGGDQSGVGSDGHDDLKGIAPQGALEDDGGAGEDEAVDNGGLGGLDEPGTLVANATASGEPSPPTQGNNGEVQGGAGASAATGWDWDVAPATESAVSAEDVARVPEATVAPVVADGSATTTNDPAELPDEGVTIPAFQGEDSGEGGVQEGVAGDKEEQGIVGLTGTDQPAAAVLASPVDGQQEEGSVVSGAQDGAGSPDGQGGSWLATPEPVAPPSGDFVEGVAAGGGSSGGSSGAPGASSAAGAEDGHGNGGGSLDQEEGPQYGNFQGGDLEAVVDVDVERETDRDGASGAKGSLLLSPPKAEELDGSKGEAGYGQQGGYAQEKLGNGGEMGEEQQQQQQQQQMEEGDGVREKLNGDDQPASAAEAEDLPWASGVTVPENQSAAGERAGEIGDWDLFPAAEEEGEKGWEGGTENEEWQLHSTKAAATGPEDSVQGPQDGGEPHDQVGVENSAGPDAAGGEAGAAGGGSGDEGPVGDGDFASGVVDGGAGDGGSSGEAASGGSETSKGKACASKYDCGDEDHWDCHTSGVCGCRFPWTGASCEEDGCLANARTCDECRDANERAARHDTSFGCVWESDEGGYVGGSGSSSGSGSGIGGGGGGDGGGMCKSSRLPLSPNAFSACPLSGGGGAVAAGNLADEPTEAFPQLWYAAGLPLVFVVLCGGVLMLVAKCVRRCCQRGADEPTYTKVDTANADDASGGDNWGWDGDEDEDDIEMPPSSSSKRPSSSSSSLSSSNQQHPPPPAAAAAAAATAVETRGRNPSSGVGGLRDGLGGNLSGPPAAPLSSSGPGSMMLPNRSSSREGRRGGSGGGAGGGGGGGGDGRPRSGGAAGRRKKGAGGRGASGAAQAGKGGHADGIVNVDDDLFADMGIEAKPTFGGAKNPSQRPAVSAERSLTLQASEATGGVDSWVDDDLDDLLK